MANQNRAMADWPPGALTSQAPMVMVLVLAFVVPLELLAGLFARTSLQGDLGHRSSTPSGSRASAANSDAGS